MSGTSNAVRGAIGRLAAHSGNAHCKMTTRGIRRKKSSLSEVKVAVIGAPSVGKSGMCATTTRLRAVDSRASIVCFDRCEEINESKIMHQSLLLLELLNDQLWQNFKSSILFDLKKYPNS